MGSGDGQGCQGDRLNGLANLSRAQESDDDDLDLMKSHYLGRCAGWIARKQATVKYLEPKHKAAKNQS